MKEFLKRILTLSSKPIKYKRQEVHGPVRPKYNVPDIIPDKHKNLFIEQALKANVTPEQFGQIVKREQGPRTTFENAAMVGGADPKDRGLMQVNKINEPMIQERFMKEYGRPYNPNSTPDSIIAASFVLQEHKKQFNNKIKNQTYSGDITGDVLIDSYNLGPTGYAEALQGDAERQFKLNRYRQAGQ
tara:strand:+ start:863 stop:1423 length:561 start_codon:yes stop_codon:yes gene_type:complete